MGRVVVAGAFDTKAEPLSRLVEALASLGEMPITIDTGVFGAAQGYDYPASVVAEAAGYAQGELPPLGRAGAVAAMSDGAAQVLGKLACRGEIGALVCMGGSGASAIFTKLVPIVPIGIPKILMSTGAAGETRHLVNGSDVILLYPIVDIEGDNSILRGMIDRLARVAVGALRSGQLRQPENADRSVALSMYGVTTACVAQCRSLLAEQGYESFVFHVNGTGGRSLEAFAAQARVSLVIDVTISELVDELFGGLWPAGPDRLRTAARRGVPQVIAPGAIDMICIGPLADAPEHFRRRVLAKHNDLVTLIRTTPEENRRLGACVAERLGQPKAPTSLMVPRRGVSELDIEGGPFFDPEAMAAFVDGLRSQLASGISVIELDLHINDPEFAQALVAEGLACRDRAPPRVDAEKGG